jgi:uncharacterized protein
VSRPEPSFSRRIDFVSAKAYALDRLERELDPRLHYHSLVHTHEDVVPAVARLASVLGITGEMALLLQTAAYYHDIGFVVQIQHHEAAGAQIAAEVLPCYGYRPRQIALIRGMIMATRMPQAPRTPLEMILADADLDALGRDDFLNRNYALRSELSAFGVHMTDEEWYRDQIAFLETHRYWTTAAHVLRDAGKARNLLTMYECLEQSATSRHPMRHNPTD